MLGQWRYTYIRDKKKRLFKLTFNLEQNLFETIKNPAIKVVKLKKRNTKKN